ncbi:30S ribosomal protein S16 [Candidatus Berkelbacteria bacterium]|nr:30S ribosomal protein S16 [Candidatus Berkelbacteria bacterium]
MLVIRLRRTGKKNKPTYRIIVAEHTMPVNGKFTDDLGFYNPHTKQTSISKEKVEKWLGNGAKPSNTVAKILINEKIKHNSIVFVKKNKKSKKTAEEPKVKNAPQQEATEEVIAETENNTEATKTNPIVTDQPIAEEAQTEEVQTEEVTA